MRSQRSEDRSQDRPLRVSTVQLFGMALLAVVVVVWIVKGQESVLLVAAAMSMIGASGIFEFAVYQAGKIRARQENDK